MSEPYEVVDGLEICAPRVYDDCPVCDEEHTYVCGRTLLLRNVENKEERCPDGTFLCNDCFDVGAKFLERAYNAQAIDSEWEGG
jgi:hypothetical protein